LSLTVLSSFFFHHPPPTDIYPLSLHDALPIYRRSTVDSREFISRDAHDARNHHWRGRRDHDARRRRGRAEANRRADRLARRRARSEGTRLNSSHVEISYAVFCLKKKKK